ncbi:MAG: FAD-dependent oxidoreductase [Oscillospiraceae bacterium]|nr:FAD-dependent oxidoreductase [Oscillospiraceae bacterium]
MSRIYTEPARTLPCIGSFDVVVAGGGFAGVSAALAAARNGMQVCLVEKNCSLGGLGTLGLVVDYLPLCDGQGTQLVGGIAEELMLGVSRYDGSAPPLCWKPGQIGDRAAQRYMLTYQPAAMELYLEELLLEAGVTLFYDTRFCDVVRQKNRLEGLIVENKSGRAVVAGSMFIDASGDADVCVVAGEEIFESGQNVCAWWFYSHKEGRNILNRRSENFYTIKKGSRTYKVSDHADVTALSVDSRKKIRQYLLEQQEQPLLLSAVPQFRMTRRVVGRETVGQEDDGRWMDSCIGMTGDWRKAGPRFCIPYGSICPVKTKNLLVAGRCISTTESGWDIMRVIPVCAVTGQAAGTAAAMAAKHGSDTRLVCVKDLQTLLKQQGVIMEKEYMYR